MALSNDELETWKRLAHSATPGPWRSTPFGIVYSAIPSSEQQTANDAFTAAARSAVPSLIAEVERLRRELDRALNALESPDRAR